MFKLSIECTKDIDIINIQFSDGKMASVSTQQPQSRDSQILSTQDYNTQTITPVTKPEVPNTDSRDVNVASDLQNLDI